MPFSRMAEIGRVVIVNYGPETGKLLVISDIVDQNRALVDRPDEVRRVINFKRLAITDLKVDIPRLAKKSVLKEALATSDVFGKFAKSAWGQKLAKRQAKLDKTDFQRHQDLVSRRRLSLKTNIIANKLKKQAA